MNESKIIDFFEDMKIFKEKQTKQKQRGLNDYNLLTTILNAHDEVRLHSRVIGSFLDINGLHYQGSLFLEKFLSILDIKDFEFDIDNSKLVLEYNNIDLYLTDGQKHIIIENKVYADDQENQIQRYIELIQNENETLEVNDILVIYLSINRQKPSIYSLDHLTIKDNYICKDEKELTLFKNINYHTEIIDWLKLCLNEIQNITNLNESILQYLSVVEKITNKYKGKVMEIKDFLLEEDNLKLVTELETPIKDAKAQIQYKFWMSLQESLNSKQHVFDFVNSKFEEIVIEDYTKNYYNSNKNNRCYGLKKDLFEIDDNHKVCFYIEIDWRIYYGFTISENGKRKEIPENQKIKEILNKTLNKENSKWKSPNNYNQKLFISWKLLDNELNFNSFKPPKIFDLNKKSKRDIIIEEIATEIDKVIKEIMD